MINQNRKNIFTVILFSSTLAVLAGCSAYDVKKPKLTNDNAKIYTQQIDDASKKLENKEITNTEKLTAIQNQGIGYERLGKYDKAIAKYEEILKIAPTNFIALNNLSAIYEEVGEIGLARKYVSMLFTAYKNDTQTNQGVITDTIRILTANKEFDVALNVLQEYAQNFQSNETSPFISEQYEFIARMKGAANK